MKTIAPLLFWIALIPVTVCAEQGSYESVVLAKSSKSWDGSKLPRYTRGTAEVAIMKITIPPGSELPLHKHPSINAGYLVKGELTVHTEEGKTLHLKSGEALIEVVNRWHYGKNEGSEPAEIIVFYAGRENLPVTIKK